MLKNITLLIFLTAALSACREGIPESVDQEFIKAGQVEGAIYYSNWSRSDTVFIDTNHEDIKLIDLNNDGAFEFEIVSTEDTVTAKISSNELRDYHVKTLFLRKHRENIYIAVESITYSDYVEIIQKNSILNFDSQIWNPLDSVKIFCQWERNIQAGFSYDWGDWNDHYNKYFAVHFQHDEETLISWVEISVVDYDNYILHNYASFILD
jgi:hypothetical protein